MKKIDQNLSEISAEVLLNYFYPEMADAWKVQNEGTFYRNFNRDLLAYDEETGEVQVARDGFVKLLPASMLYPESSLKGKGKRQNAEHLTEQRRLFQDMFQPFDILSFRRTLAIERQVYSLLEEKMQYILTTYFHYDLAAETNPYVKEIAVLLPFVRNMRGDYRLLRKLLASLFGFEVTCRIDRFSDTDQTRSWLPQVTYEILVEGLSTEEYEAMNREKEGLIQFLQEWFIPFDVKCYIIIKWHNQSWNDANHWLLDYNTELKV